MIYANFEGILVPEDNVMQNREESYTNKFQEHVACSYGYKLVCVGHKFSKHFRFYLDEDAVYNFVNGMIEENKFCIDIMKNIFNNKLLMTKEDD